MHPLVFWLLVTIAWFCMCFVGYRILLRVAPRFAAAHSLETGAAVAILVAALLYAALSS